MSQEPEPSSKPCRSEAILVAGAPRQCRACASLLCLRKQVINLALGNTEDMLCLNCLAAESNQTPAEVLESIKTYIAGRECFYKEWRRYESVEYCPDRNGCLPDICFDSQA